MIILVVGDSKIQAQTIEQMLKAQGWDVVLAENGQDGMRKLREYEPDLILSDIDMPIIDGYDFCRLVKGSPFKYIPFILISSIGEMDSKLKGLEIGADDFLIKPISERELNARIRSFQKIKDYQDRLEESLNVQKEIRTKLELAYKQQLKELERAKVTQQSILPAELPKIAGINVVVKYIPVNTIGGDFYDVIQLDEKQVGLFVADVTGHGISAAMIAFMASSAFKTYCGSKNTPGSTMRLINEFLLEKIESNKFVTAWYGVYNKETQQISFSSAGHPPSLVIRSKTKEVFSLSTPSMALGLFPNDINGFKSDSFQMESGDKILIYTDGIFENLNEFGEQFGVKRLKDYLIEKGELPLENWIESLYNHVLSYSGQSTYDDDITIVALEVLE